MLKFPMENKVPSSSQFCRLYGVVSSDEEIPMLTPVTKGMFATLPLRTRFNGVSFKNRPSVRGNHIRKTAPGQLALTTPIEQY